jgi:hypothetical protein
VTAAPAVVEALVTEHRLEMSRMEARVAGYRALLEEHGIPLPQDPAAEALDAYLGECRRLAVAASEFVASLGTSAELLANRWREA